MFKKIVLSVICAAALLFGVTFTIKNAQVVELSYYFGIDWQGPLSWLVIVVLILGILLGMLICFISNLKRKLTHNKERDISPVETS